MFKTPNSGAAMNVRGNLVVIVIVIVMGIAALVTVLFKPAPMSSIEVARQKQLLVFGNLDSTPTEKLKLVPQESLDVYIELLNYILRMRDSLSMMSQANVAASDIEYSIDEANQKLAITGLSQRETAARAKARQVAGGSVAPIVDSLYDLVHQPMPKFPEDSILIRERNLTFGKYIEQIAE